MRTNVNLSIPGTNVRLGDKAKCVVTGFIGIVTTHSKHLTGCDTVWLKGKVNEKGESPTECVDVQLLKRVSVNPLKMTPMPTDIPAAG